VADLAALAGRDGRAELASALAGWLPDQRWFAGKARTLAGVVVADAVLLEAGGQQVIDVVIDVAFDDGHRERYQVPLAEAGQAPAAVEVGGLRAADATALPWAARLLAEATASSEARLSETGATVTGHPVTWGALRLGPARRLSAEQSNTSVVYGNDLILKLFRRLEAGVNPDVEVTRALTEAGFEHVPAQHGALELIAPDGSATALAVLSDFVAGGREGWELATAEVARLRDSPVGCALEDPVLHDALADLGRAVAGMHRALRSAFGARPLAAEDVAGWAPAMRTQLEGVVATAARLAPEAAAAVLERRGQLAARLDELLSTADGGELVRIHGDLHLGQVLLDPAGRWQLLDFEGEPVRSLAERRAPSAALRDVAGMLRSFDYAAASLAVDGAVPEPVGRWRDDARRRFLEGYLDEARGVTTADAAGWLPADDRAIRAQLALFELDKAVYELGYELANRPRWVPVPVKGILRVLDSQRRPG
jgi:maltokinase